MASAEFPVTTKELVEFVTADRVVQFRTLQKKFGGVAGLADKLKTTLEDGLARTEVDSPHDRRQAYGDNHMPDPPSKSFFAVFMEGAGDVTIIILAIAAIISLVFGIAFPPQGEAGTAWIEGVAILVTVFLVLTVAAGNNYAKEKQFKELDKQKQTKPVEVVRYGAPMEISSDDLMVGDIALLKQGERVPADGVFVDGCGTPECRLDQSAMTGESAAVVINPKNPVMISGAIVEDGLARMLVVAVGESSQYGILFKNLQEDDEQTPLEEKLDTLARWIGYFGMVAGSLIFAVLLIVYAIQIATGTETISKCLDVLDVNVYRTVCWDREIDLKWDTEALSKITEFAIVAITIIVVAVPEGLPLAVAISLAYSMQQMMTDQCLVRRLAACETMGGATTICSDKTGTLTENRMSVVKGWLLGNTFESIPLGFTPDAHAANVFFNGVALNSTANVAPPKVPGGLPEFTGPKTECALLVFAPHVSNESNYQHLRKTYKDKIVKMFPFTSDRKRMSVAVQVDDDSAYRLYTKGASELILERSAYMVGKDGQITSITDTDREQLNQLIEDLADQGLRTIGLAYREFSDTREFVEADDDDDDEIDPPEYELTLQAIVGIMDPIRKEVPGAVKTCQQAGIVVRMVTGDNLKTAVKIAKDCGIYTLDGLALNGPDFRSMSDTEIDRILPRLQVLARSIPTDKKRLVKRLKANKQVVAVTGDGTNDAPALKAAHVGLAMGRSGTDVAKQASDIVILDDNFASIVMAVLWGRCVYDNIKKFLQFQLTVNFAAVAVALVAALSDRGTPLTATQLLWVNLIMDTLAALALATEKPTPDLLERKPYGLDEKVPISAVMWRNILGQAVYQITVLLLIIYFGAEWLGIEDKGTAHYTIVFNAFV
eukprot:TRINITY_DN4649_c0_g1_i2.p1 TRINITY_DN4649_c0_g1~~TRINITY_DN4649_c0_g1_i2.p1  ORF type:complete len:894 (+),score=154.17 TRINITY_DN4649_c0_g1_i2:24-2684(+)